MDIIILFLLKVINWLIHKNGKTLLFIPHKNCKIDGYDIFNYSADNTLCLFMSIINDPNFCEFDLWLMFYDLNRKKDYEEYLDNYRKRKGKIVLVNANNRKERLQAYLKFNYCFFSESYLAFLYKTKKQRVIGLNYFTPFKSDQNTLTVLSKKNVHKRWLSVNKSIDYEMSTSNLSGRISSTDSLLLFPKILPMGFPRNDIFYKDNTVLRKKIKTVLSDKGDFNYIFCYTPTYRDFERRDLALSDETMVREKSLFGNENSLLDKNLNDVLLKQHAIIIIKLHPWQEKSVIKQQNYSQFVLYSELESRMECSLYDVLAVSDCLITDYTSTAFDFLHRNKPIIYYFYDYEKYERNRGFSYDPLEYVCAGAIAYDYSELLKEIDKVIKGNDDYKEKRELVSTMFNKYRDGNSAGRIKSFIIKLTNEKAS